jgi:hypothetical protein
MINVCVQCSVVNQSFLQTFRGSVHQLARIQICASTKPPSHMQADAVLRVTTLFPIIWASSLGELVIWNTPETFPFKLTVACYIYLLKISRMYFLLRKFARNAINFLVTYRSIAPETLCNSFMTSRLHDLSVLESCPVLHDSAIPTWRSYTAPNTGTENIEGKEMNRNDTLRIYPHCYNTKNTKAS